MADEVKNISAFEALEKVEDKESFLVFLSCLSKDYVTNHDEWENLTIDAYLESISAWLRSDDNKEVSHTDFKEMAKAFYVGKIYE